MTGGCCSRFHWLCGYVLTVHCGVWPYVCPLYRWPTDINVQQCTVHMHTHTWPMVVCTYVCVTQWWPLSVCTYVWLYTSWYTGDPLVTGKLVLSWAVEGGGAGDLDDDGKVVSAAAARHAHIHAPSLTHSLSSLFLFLDPLSRGWCNEDTHQVLVLALGRVNIMLTLSGLKYSAVFMRSRFWFSSLAPRHSRVNAIGQDIDLLN